MDKKHCQIGKVTPKPAPMTEPTVRREGDYYFVKLGPGHCKRMGILEYVRSIR